MIPLAPADGARLVARLATMRTAGDVPGHEFHGNQYTGGLASYAVDKSVSPTQRDKIRKAVAFVEKQHSEHLSKIHVIIAPTGKGTTNNPYGYTVRNIKTENGKPLRDDKGNLVHSGKYTVYISSKQKSTEDFVRTISHEFEHVAQWERGEIPHEAGAITVGGLTSRKFKELSSPKAAKERTLLVAQLVALKQRRPETAVHAAADKHLKKLSVAVRYAFAMGRRALGHAGHPNVDAAANTVLMELMHVLRTPLLETLVAGGQAGLKLLPQARAAEERTLAAKLTMRFDESSPEAIQWATDHAAELAHGISDTTRQRIAQAIVDALAGDGIEAAYSDIEDAVGDEARAELIARTEVMTAANEGQREAWDQAIEAGLLTGNEKKEWIATGDANVCPQCDELDGTVVGLDEEYPNDGGDGPPAHPQCRCTEGIVG